MTSAEQFLGIDLGTSSIKFCVIDLFGNLRRFCKIPLPESGYGLQEQQPQDLWKKAIDQGFSELRYTISLRSLQAISLDATSGTIMLCNRQGQVISDVLFYDDARATDQEMQWIAQSAPPSSVVHSRSSTLARLLWLLNHPPMEKPVFCMHQADWLLHFLTGRTGLTDENNAFKLGYDAYQRCWPKWLVNCLGSHAGLLPKVAPPGTRVAPLNKDLCQRHGLVTQPEVYTGTTDSIAAVMASGIQQPGEAVTSLGSTLVLKVMSEKAINDAGTGVYSHRFGEFWLAGGASNSGGRVLSQYFDADDLKKLSEQIDTDRLTGLNYYPLPTTGERFPINDPEKSPQISPRPDNPVRFLQALFEGMASIEAQGYRILEKLGAPAIKRVVSVGGGASNLAWTRIRERFLAVPVEQAEHHEAAYGCALLARKGWMNRHHPISESVD
ncbi:MAG: carbohydrate kinase [Gammaproteobacteria bacterium]|nr:MAG: carbohydrate kinase [Gammaproteobacteria bacterium]